MHQDIVQKVRNHPRYGELISKRSRFAWILTFLMLVIYYGFILVIAFNKTLLGIPLAKGAVTTIGIPIGVFIILFAFVLTGVYVQRANREFDDITNQIKKDVQ
jgi:uncharacterized membrane protein (DUF485 family)